MAYQRTSETIKIESLKIHKKRRLERFVSGQDVSLFEPTESGKFEYMGFGTSDNKANKQSDQP